MKKKIGRQKISGKKDEYDPTEIEPKWQKQWSSSKLYKTEEDSKKNKYYVLDMFPYPSGEGLHVGHPKGYIATDVISRYRRMKGYSILHPMGFDAFGLPAENYALKMRKNPMDLTVTNIKRFKAQLEILGFDYDWSREINTTDPKYYKWTQWIFLQLLKKGLAYESFEPINWCPSCKTGLANEDIENGRCERCGTPVEKKSMKQWVLRITDYAERLLNDLDSTDSNGKRLLDWPESIKELQRNWIGRSEGAILNFKIKATGTVSTTSPTTFPRDESPHAVKSRGNVSAPPRDCSRLDEIGVFTTRPDTLFGVTYVVLAPEHRLVGGLLDSISNKKEVEDYISRVKNETEIERTDVKKEKTGVELKGVKAINPANNEAIPIWIADYVLADYGTGAVMAVPAHDERDCEFAKKFDLPIKEITLANKQEIILKFGKPTTTYKLRDWVFSRQRYWGEPIPVIHCEKCGVVSVPEKDLPVVLPKVKSYEPTGTGESPLTAIENWVNVKCPVCGDSAKRETNTMPQWAGSCWYYLRYMDTKNSKALVDPVKEKYWTPVDLYVGGAEHATRHLIYARFWHKFLYDIGVVSTIEPFMRLQHVGLIMGEDGRKMSKRFGNVINPDDLIKTFGADTLRIYEMFMGPFDQQISWNTSSMVGTRRFIEKIWRLEASTTKEPTLPSTSLSGAERLGLVGGMSSATDVVDAVSEVGETVPEKILHKTIKKVTEDIENMRFNTAISSMMILVNEFEKISSVSKEHYEILLKLLAPFAPHIAEELWTTLGNKGSIHISEWPKYDSSLIVDDEVTIAVQVNGKMRGSLVITNNMSEEEVKTKTMNIPIVKKWVDGKIIKKVIVIKGKIVSIVVE